jgi:hypothetical protein
MLQGTTRGALALLGINRRITQNGSFFYLSSNNTPRATLKFCVATVVVVVWLFLATFFFFVGTSDVYCC